MQWTGSNLKYKNFESSANTVFQLKGVSVHLTKPIYKFYAFYLCLKSIAFDLIHKLLKQRKRNLQQVNDDYDKGEWSDEFKKKRWLNVGTLEDYVVPNDSRQIIAMIEGRFVKISVSEYYAYRTNCLERVLTKYGDGTKELVELGCGTGRNLFALASKGDWNQLRGYDMSATGIDVSRAVIEHFKLDHIETGYINLLEVKSDGFSYLRGSTVFTFYCLEQLPDHVEEVIRNLVATGVKRVIHIEPSLELFSGFSLKDLVTITYVWRQNYLRNLVTVVRKLEQERLIKIVEVCRLNFAPTIRHDPTLVVWEPIGDTLGSRH